MSDALICDAIRTPIGRYGGSLAQVRPDDLGAVPLKALMRRNPGVEMIAGGVESMSRAPFVMGKADSAISRNPACASVWGRALRWSLNACDANPDVIAVVRGNPLDEAPTNP